MWQAGVNHGYEEANKIAHLIVRYTRGHVLELGAGLRKTWPHFTSVDSCIDYNGVKPPGIDIALNCKKLGLFADESWDSIFSSHLLEHMEKSEAAAALADWARVLRPGGYLVLYVPSANFYPKFGTPGANVDHKWDIYPGDIEKMLRKNTSCGWTQLEKEERSKGEEYSLYLVFKKRSDGRWIEDIWQRNPDGQKRALVIRFGAIGDILQTTSIMPGLKEQGYHITWMCHANTSSVSMNNPFVDDWIMQDQDQVPNAELGPYWIALQQEGRYDHIINLCESVEGSLLTMPGKIQHAYSDETRKRIFGKVNYYDRTHDIAAVPLGPRTKFYPTDDEAKWAIGEKEQHNAPIVIWCLTGTSHHKTYPFTQIVLRWLVEQTPAQIYLYGDKLVAKQLQDAILECMIKDNIDISRIKAICGLWSIRESLAFAQVADVVIGPETGVMNGVAFEPDVDKVIYLSHSSNENLTRDWVSTKVLAPTEAECPCYPCHRLHYDFTFCHQVEETGAALCASSIKPETIFKAVVAALMRKAAKLEAA